MRLPSYILESQTKSCITLLFIQIIFRFITIGPIRQHSTMSNNNKRDRLGIYLPAADIQLCVDALILLLRVNLVGNSRIARASLVTECSWFEQTRSIALAAPAAVCIALNS